jgi:hypothetical protein
MADPGTGFERKQIDDKENAQGTVARRNFSRNIKAANYFSYFLGGGITEASRLRSDSVTSDVS